MPSWPLCYEDCVSAPYYGKTKDALYLEGVYVGYRYYDKAQKAVAYPFGHGLSYTEFEAVRQAQHHHGYIRTPGGLHGLGDQRLIHAALGLEATAFC